MYRLFLGGRRHGRLCVSEPVGSEGPAVFSASFWSTSWWILGEVIIFSFGTVRKSAGDFHTFSKLAKVIKTNPLTEFTGLKFYQTNAVIKLKSFPLSAFLVFLLKGSSWIVVKFDPLRLHFIFEKFRFTFIIRVCACDLCFACMCICITQCVPHAHRDQEKASNLSELVL